MYKMYSIGHLKTSDSTGNHRQKSYHETMKKHKGDLSNYCSGLCCSETKEESMLSVVSEMFGHEDS